MRKLILVSVIAVVIAIAAPAIAGTHDPGFHRRMQRQRHRIQQGIRKGQLTRREAARLKHSQARIVRMERRFSADGKLTPRERKRLHKALNRQNQAIYRQRHDQQRQ